MITVLTPATSRRLTTAQALYEETKNVIYLEEPSLTDAMIDRASRAIESYCGHIFAQQRYQEVRCQEHTQILALRHYPVVQVESVLSGTESVTDYRLDDADRG